MKPETHGQDQVQMFLTDFFCGSFRSLLTLMHEIPPGNTCILEDIYS